MLVTTGWACGEDVEELEAGKDVVVRDAVEEDAEDEALREGEGEGGEGEERDEETFGVRGGEDLVDVVEERVWREVACHEPTLEGGGHVILGHEKGGIT